MIQVSTPLLNGNELKYVTKCIKDNWISGDGPFVKIFEKNFAEFVGRKYGICVSNGTIALDLAIKS